MELGRSLLLIALRGFFGSQTLRTHTPSAFEKRSNKMSWTDPMATHGADLPFELTEVGSTDRTTDGSNLDGCH
jgi:hypothetical protein